MISWINSWAKGIIISVVIGKVICMILPDNSSRKYIKIIIGIFVVYTIISPIFSDISGKNIDEYININNYVETSANITNDKENLVNMDDSIKKIYCENLKNDLKNKLKEIGYISNDIGFIISDDGKYSIEKINIKIDEKVNSGGNNNVKTIVDNIKAVKVIVENGGKHSDEIIDDNDKNVIRDFVKQTYEVKDECIEVR